MSEIQMTEHERAKALRQGQEMVSCLLLVGRPARGGYVYEMAEVCSFETFGQNIRQIKTVRLLSEESGRLLGRECWMLDGLDERWKLLDKLKAKSKSQIVTMKDLEEINNGFVEWQEKKFRAKAGAWAFEDEWLAKEI